MKIALIHYRMLLKGGLERRLFSYIEYFKQRGDEVHVIVCKISPKIEIPEGIHLHQIKLKLFPKRVRQLIFDRRLKKLMQRNSFDFSLSLGRTSHQDAVLAPGNHLGYLQAQNKTPRGYWDRIQIYLDRNAYQNSSLIYAASGMMAEEVRDLFEIPAEKIHVLCPPLDTDRFFPELKEKKQEFREKYGFDSSKKSFLFISTGHKRKGLPLLLKVFAQLEKEKVELLIAGYPEVVSPLNNVKYLGFISEVEELYAAADFTIHPSIYEPYGQIVAESLQCGTPVLISHQVGAKEVVSAKEGRVVEGFGTQLWVDEIRSALNSSFYIAPHFAERNQLTLTRHIEKMLKIAGKWPKGSG